MKSAATRILTISLLVLSIGFHWAFLQGIAWAGMLARYAADQPIQIAIEKTFSGQHPCTICKLVEQGRKSDGEGNGREGPAPKLDYFLPMELQVFTFPPLALDATPSYRPGSFQASAPPTPPPRLG